MNECYKGPEIDSLMTLFNGTFVSVRAGVLEELCFRYFFFLALAPLIVISDFILGGFAFEWGLLHIIHYYIFAPIADFMTFGMLTQQIYGSHHWALGAALLSSNATFRDGHKYQGVLGWINSWFLGMVFFWIMFNYGLWAAIVVHFLYDMELFIISAFAKFVSGK